ncbi:MAG: glycosyltransferase family 2 protein [Pseudomonadales bacterium]|nr:glycosyltransferase family 2 protein [Pseudomonadales bacterium]
MLSLYLMTLISGVLIVYHHALYPLLLVMLTRTESSRIETVLGFKKLKNYLPGHPSLDFTARAYQACAEDEQLPSICIIMPAFNEAAYIADKIRNLAQLDYPQDKLQVYIGCDGCTDDTAAIIRQTLREPECRQLSVHMWVFDQNCGKVTVLNRLAHRVSYDLMAFTDVSALLACDALFNASQLFMAADVGAVAGGYQLLKGGSEGESRYWHYQRKIKQSESRCGSVLGCHGAFYIFRARLFQALDSDIINDDFVIPMQIAARGYRVIYAPEVAALEQEVASLQMDFKRRQRIAAGNLQQLMMLLNCLNPKQGMLAFNFASGKALRVFMPLCLIVFFLGCALLVQEHVLWACLFIAQCGVYLLVLLTLFNDFALRLPMFPSIYYLVMGHGSALVGSVAYLCGRYRMPWKKISI